LPFVYDRIIRFADTDSAGVVFFANLLTICHEAYEASLLSVGIDIGAFFSSAGEAVPIVQAEVSFLAPLYCGDRVSVAMTAQQVNSGVFVCRYRLTKNGQMVAQAQTKHAVIDRATRQKCALTEALQGWLAQTGAEEQGQEQFL
jgi:1,4-dihydroxy-2-naphthoyl-CoA hydrolase